MSLTIVSIHIILTDDFRQEKTLAASITSLLESPNQAKLTPPDLCRRLVSILPLVVKANSNHAKEIRLTTFTSIQSFFEHVPADLSLENAQAKATLEKLLFNPSFEGLPEAMRMKRAEALAAVAKVKGCQWIIEMVKAEVCGGREKSSGVRSVLATVGEGRADSIR